MNTSHSTMTNIICRLDPANKPVVFITDSIDKGQILAWQNGAEPEIVGLDYYHKTQPLSEADRTALAAKYSKTFSDKRVYIRERLPRVYQNLRSVLAADGTPKASVKKAAKRMVKTTAKHLKIVPKKAVSNMEIATAHLSKDISIEQLAVAIAKIIKPLL